MPPRGFRNSGEVELVNQLEKQGLGKKFTRQNSSIEERLTSSEKRRKEKKRLRRESKASKPSVDPACLSIESGGCSSPRQLLQSDSSHVVITSPVKTEAQNNLTNEDIEHKYPF